MSTELSYSSGFVNSIDKTAACDISSSMQRDTLSPAEQLYAGIQLTRPLLRYITSRVETDLAGTGVSVGQRAILEVLLAIGPATAPEITKTLDVKRQFVGRELKEMAAKGMVSTTDNPLRKASMIYSLKQASRKMIEEIRSREMTEFTAFSERFTPEQIKAFYNVQRAIYEEFSKP